jgi:hypothetical protein
MEVGQGPNWGCSAKEKNNNKKISERCFSALQGVGPSFFHLMPVYPSGPLLSFHVVG